jgi:uncharacterized membrane protein YgaE (UPF0421/DUF939 family)
MMEERVLVGWGYRFLKFLFLIMVGAGIFFLGKLFLSRIPPDLEEHRPQLDHLERAYESRRAVLIQRAEERVKNALNEVLAIQYQQELNSGLARLEQRYFVDRQAILKSNYRVLEENWPEEIKSTGEGGEDDSTSSLEH